MAENYQQLIDELLLLAVQKGASDIHLSPGYYPTIRVDEILVPLADRPILDRQTVEGISLMLMGDARKQQFITSRECDFSYQIGNDPRFRVNIYWSKGNMACVLRYIHENIRSIEDLHLPQQVNIFAKLSQGFVLVAGPTGHGKSTTLAAIINAINQERAEKIITIEDPIEYIIPPERSIIDQRELGGDTLSFANALRAAFRENVNVIMVGELRDFETMSASVTAAETGHLVLGSIHTNSAAQTIERIIDMFPPTQQHQIINQLADTLSGVISQRLIPGLRGGLVPAVEVMVATTAVRNIIRDNKIEQLNLAISTGAEAGMISLNHSLADLVRTKQISDERAEFYSPNLAELRGLLKI